MNMGTYLRFKINNSHVRSTSMGIISPSADHNGLYFFALHSMILF